MDSRNYSHGHITPLRSVTRDNSLNSSGSRLVNSNRFSPFQTSSPKVIRSNSGSPAGMNRSLTGPLLTSMNFNSNLSTYMDSRSPGLAERVVQYNKNELQKPCITHQPKYGSPGIFPVVHLFKKTIPIRTIAPNHKVTVRMASQDVYQSYNNDNKSLSIQQSSSNDIEKSNVLEALKNISKKRMLVEDDYIPPNNSKRHCRQLDESELTIESQPSTSKDGVPFVINAITASLSSSHPYLIPSLQKKASTSALQQKTTLCNMETQTETDSITINTVADVHEAPSINKKKILKIVDESPKDDDDNCEEIKNTSSPATPIDENKLLKEKQLESVKRNKLTKFLCLLSRESSDKAVSDVTETDASSKTNKVTTSILSPENKPKHNRHVTFDLPEKEKVKDLLENTKTNIEVAPFTLNSGETKKAEGFSVGNNKENVGFAVSKNKETGGFGTESKKENGGFSLGQMNQNLGFTFGKTSEKEVSKEGNIQAVTVTTTSELNTVKPAPSLPPMFTSGTNESPIPMSSSPKLGGFKFDFKSSTSAATAPPPQFGSGDTTGLLNAGTASSTTISNQTSVNNASVTFGLLPSQPVQSSKSIISPPSTSGIFTSGFGTQSLANPTLGSNTNVTSSSNLLFSTGFGTAALPNPISSPPKTNLMQPNASTIFSTSNSPAKSAESNTNVTSSTASAIFSTGFGTTSTSNSAPFAFGSKSNNETKSSGINFGNPNAQNSNENKSLFTVSTLAPTNISQPQGFAAPTSINNLFGSKFGVPVNSFNTTTSTLSAPSPFPTLATTTTVAATTNNAFNSIFAINEQKPSLQTSIPAFGTNNVTSTTTSALSNDNLKTTSFGSGGSTFTFGSTSAAPSFGNTFQFGRDKSNVAEPNPQKPIFKASAASKPQTDFFKFGTSNPASNVASPFNTSTTLAPPPAFNTAPATNQPSAFNTGVSLPNPTSPFNSNPLPKPSTFTSSFGANQPFDLTSGSKVTSPSFNMAPNSASSVPALPIPSVPSSFNNMFGSVPTTMFNAQPNPNFSMPSFNNANNGAPPQFGAAQPGMFNIGSGSATPRNRTTLKARRRT